MANPAATALDRILEYVNSISTSAKPISTGELSVISAENMLVDAMCLQAALTAFLMRCDLQREEK